MQRREKNKSDNGRRKDKGRIPIEIGSSIEESQKEEESEGLESFMFMDSGTIVRTEKSLAGNKDTSLARQAGTVQ